MVEVSEIGLEEEIELDLGLSIGGSFRKTENPKPVREPYSKADGFDWDLKEQHQAWPEMDPQKKREIHALRRQEAKRKREQKRGTCRGGRNGGCARESEPEEQRVSKKEKTGHNGGSECGNTMKNVNLDLNNTTAGSTASFPVAQAQQQHPYASVQFVPFNNGFAYPCVVPCWTPSVNEKNVGAQPQAVVACRGFRPFQVEPGLGVNPGSGCELEQNGERDESGGDRKTKSNGSSWCSSVVSDYQSTSHEGGGSSDSHSHSAQSLAEPTQLNSSKENNTRTQPEQTTYSQPTRSEHGNIERPNHIVKQVQPVAITLPNQAKPKEEVTVESKAVPIDHSHMCNENSSNGHLKEAKTDMGKPPKPLSQTSSLPQMPYVSTTGNGPNGKTINGFLYRYTKSEVSIVCVCHGSTFSPAEFVQHAGGTDIAHPLRHITVIPSAFG